jgi:hypothetical protein
MRILNSRCAVVASALLLSIVATGSEAQNRGAPIIRISSQNGPGVASNYVSPVIDLGEDAYVFVVSVDLDGQIQVLHPEFPGISVRLRREQQFRLPNFFAGFSRNGGGIVGAGRYSNYYSNMETVDDTRGTVIALASRVPFNLDQISSGGDWNIAKIRNLLQYRAPLSAAAALASYVRSGDEPVGMDYMRFASARAYQFGGYADALYGCDLYYGGYSQALGFNRLGLLAHVARLQREGQNVRIVGFDFCGMPIVSFGRSTSVARANPRPPREPADSGKTKRPHFPRHTGEGEPGQPAAALGYFPKAGPGGRPQAPEVIAAPAPRSRVGGEVLIDNRNQPATMPERRVEPPEHVAPPRNQGAAVGTVQMPQYSRPILREAPPPRVEPSRATPPPPPPPRMEPRAVTVSPRLEAKPAEPPPKQKQ